MLRKIPGIILLVLAVWILLLITGWDFPYRFRISVSCGLIGLITGVFVIWQPRLFREKFCLKKTEFGELRISRPVIDDIVRISISEIPDSGKIRVTGTGIKQDSEGLIIKINCIPDKEQRIDSSITEQIQKKVFHDVNYYTGIQVKEVKVQIK